VNKLATEALLPSVTTKRSAIRYQHEEYSILLYLGSDPNRAGSRRRLRVRQACVRVIADRKVAGDIVSGDMVTYIISSHTQSPRHHYFADQRAFSFEIFI